MGTGNRRRRALWLSASPGSPTGYPQFFSPQLLAWRDTIYPAGRHFAQAVRVGSWWVKDDAVRRYHTDPDKIQVIPEAAPTQTSAAPSGVLVEPDDPGVLARRSRTVLAATGYRMVLDRFGCEGMSARYERTHAR